MEEHGIEGHTRHHFPLLNPCDPTFPTAKAVQPIEFPVYTQRPSDDSRNAGQDLTVNLSTVHSILTVNFSSRNRYDEGL